MSVFINPVFTAHKKCLLDKSLLAIAVTRLTLVKELEGTN